MTQMKNKQKHKKAVKTLQSLGFFYEIAKKTETEIFAFLISMK
jgi:hypothetical protein